MADPYQAEKEAEMGIDYDGDWVQQGTASPVDCWELIGSSPGSPLPEARGDHIALEEAIASACSSGSLLQDSYVEDAHTDVDDGVLIITTAMADKQKSDDVGHLFERDEGLDFLASDIDATGHCPVRSDSAVRGDQADNTELMGYDDCMQYDDLMHDKDIHHHELPSSSNLVCYDDQVQRGIDELNHIKIYDESVMYHNELLERVDRLHAEKHLYLEGSTGIDCDHSWNINQPGNACGAVGDVHAHGISSCPESPVHSTMSGYETMGESHTNMHQASGEGRSSTLQNEETGGEVTRQSGETVDVQHGTIDAHGKGQLKGFAYMSWLWTHVIRWQTQLGHANSIWSVAFAAAVMGLLVLGRGWQRLQAQNQTLRSQLWAKEKRITQLMFQLMQTKDALVKVRRVPVICVKPSLQVPQDNF